MNTDEWPDYATRQLKHKLAELEMNAELARIKLRGLNAEVHIAPPGGPNIEVAVMSATNPIALYSHDSPIDPVDEIVSESYSVKMKRLGWGGSITVPGHFAARVRRYLELFGFDVSCPDRVDLRRNPPLAELRHFYLKVRSIQRREPIIPHPADYEWNSRKWAKAHKKWIAAWNRKLKRIGVKGLRKFYRQKCGIPEEYNYPVVLRFQTHCYMAFDPRQHRLYMKEPRNAAQRLVAPALQLHCLNDHLEQTDGATKSA